jgi:hypothetical protein
MTVGALVLTCTFGGALAGMWLRNVLPEQHLTEDSKTTVKVCIGLIATMTALVLGLVTAAAKSSFESVGTAIEHSAADIMTLDRTLARYGPESRDAREALNHAVTVRLRMTWPEDSSRASELVALDVLQGAERVVSVIRELSPRTAEQEWLQSRALSLGEALLAQRWAVLGPVGSSVLRPFVVVLVLWLTITFTSFGLFGPANITVIATLLLSALSVAGAVFLVLEMDGPFDGLITVSPEPLRYALAWMRQ